MKHARRREADKIICWNILQIKPKKAVSPIYYS